MTSTVQLITRGGFGLIAMTAVGTAVAVEPPIYTGPETVVTAGRFEQKLSETLQATTVIRAEDIEESGQLTLAEVLQQYGGVEITTSGARGASGVFIRGANTDHTLVLVDGLRIGSATLGTTAFENIPLDQIERIEIVSGPISGLYGSDAIGGVIQIFTKSGRYSPGASVSAGAGSHETGSVNAAISSGVNDTDFTVSAGYFYTGGISATKPTISFNRFNPDDDPYWNYNFSAKVAHYLGAQHEFGATAFHSRGKSYYDNGLATEDIIDQTLSAYSVYSRNQINPTWQSLLRLGTGRDDSESLGSTPGEFQTDQDQITWQNTLEFANSSLILGAENLEQEVTSTTAFAVTKREIRSVFGGFRGDYGNHGIQANLRRDHNSQFEDATTGSLAYGYRLTEEMKVRAAYGTGFKAPTFNELFFPGFGNPNLEPEESDNREVGFDYRKGKQRFSVTYFDNRIEKLIVFVFDPVTSTLLPQNLEEARIRGTELSYQGVFGNTELRVRATFQDPEDVQTGSQLQRRARKFGSMSVARTFGTWKLGPELVAAGARFDSSNEDPSTRMSGYALLNLLITRELSPDWSVEARWNNVTDKQYELAQGFTTLGSNVFVAIRWAPRT